tara:strand:- start:55 stop:411 length:357 start_codon:yes stop_codon:yes gene_type:complete
MQSFACLVIWKVWLMKNRREEMRDKYAKYERPEGIGYYTDIPKEYAVLVWDSPEDPDNNFLGSPCREFNVHTLSEAIKIYTLCEDVYAKELHHYYQTDTHGWESSSNCLMSYVEGEEE